MHKNMKINEDNIGAVAYIFEKEAGCSLGELEENEINNSGLAEESPFELAENIIKLLTQNKEINESFRTSLYWALSKRDDRSLIKHFSKWLRYEVNNNSSSIYQILIALSNLGESVFGSDRNGSYSYFDTELNLRDAKEYLNNNA